MTETQKALLDQLFQKGGNPSDVVKVEIRQTLSHPDLLSNPLYVGTFDKIAADLIRDMERTAAALKVYRVALAERSAVIDAAPSIPVIRLERRRNPYDERIYYHLSTFRRLRADGTDIRETSQKFAGRERRKALAAFDAYVAAHPDAIAENHIAAS